MATQVFLGLSVLVWLPYGLFCLFQPGFLEGAAGVAATTSTGAVELRAMYGGLQAAIGVLCAAGLRSPSWRDHALVASGVLASGLFLARLVGAGMAGEVSSYTGGALVFELLIAGAAFLLLRRHAAPALA